ncbi:TonB-dependent receptor [Shewanella surugensis]|uniref:TonB-dependent receptor n=1 Tax=Shewanella surugensis TaxID=212020 RepID=A0ABT0LE22_9GAMM|nr:TonB-dependent receptor [Shewanella surugensis]MCL1125745.1 TonB-dependent receptor [Shewanella surugensis]
MGIQVTKLAQCVGQKYIHPSMLALTLLSSALSSILLSPTAFAAENSTEETASSEKQVKQTPLAYPTESNIDEVITVIGRVDTTPLNIAANVNVIDSVDIALSGATTLTDVLRGQSGIQITDSNSGPVFSMRGFSGSQASNNTLILMDGRRLNNIDIAAPSVGAIPLNQVERVEILSGSAGVLYGDQAVGGVINIITRSPDDTGGNVQLLAGNYGTYEGRADVSAKINDEWSVYLAGSQNESDNYRKHNSNNTGSILGRLQYQTASDDFFVETSYYDNKQDLPGALTATEYQDDPRQVGSSQGEQHEMTSASRSGYRHQLNSTWALSTDVTYTDSLINASSTSVYGTSILRNERSLLELQPKVTASFPNGKGNINLISGIDYNLGNAKFTGTYINREDKQNMASVYSQVTVPLTSSVSLVTGGRYAHVKDDLTDNSVYPDGVDLNNEATAFELGVNYRPSSAHRFYLRGESNFRFAKVDEQAYTSAGVYGLKPQTGESVEAGWDWITAYNTIRVNLYRLDLEDEIVFDSSADSPSGGFFPGANVNADASRRYGLSLDWDWQVASIWQVGLDYSYIDAEFTHGENKGKALSWVAKHSGRAFTSVDLTDDLQAFVEAVYTGRQYLDGDNSNSGPKLSSYTLTNIALNYNLNDWLASIRVDNLFNQKYVSAGYYSYGTGYYYSGTERMLTVSASYRF